MAGGCACTHAREGFCCLRDPITGYCRALDNCNFYDGYCHFRKEKVDGPNKYDEMRRELAKRK